MSASTEFAIASLISWLIPVALAVAFFLAPRPSNALLRAVLGVVAGWIAMVVMTAVVFVPAGIAASHEPGTYFREEQFGSGVIVASIIGGWMAPLFAVLVAAAVRLLVRKLRARPGSGDG